jgi:hypothetical protein
MVVTMAVAAASGDRHTVKKGSDFPVPSRAVTNQTLHGRETGKSLTFFIVHTEVSPGRISGRAVLRATAATASTVFSTLRMAVMMATLYSDHLRDPHSYQFPHH